MRTRRGQIVIASGNRKRLFKLDWIEEMELALGKVKKAGSTPIVHAERDDTLPANRAPQEKRRMNKRGSAFSKKRRGR